MPGRESRLHYLILPLAALIAVHPLIIHGYSCGHDFDFHLVNWLEVARQLAHGNLLPHWAYTPAWNAAEPRFIFYPPLSWIIGGILGLILPWPWTPVVYTWLALTAAGLSLYRLARGFTTSEAALLAATFYIVNPYTLFTAFERTAYAELLAAAWIPLLLHAILCDKISIPGIAVPVALLWLTNAPAAVMCCYALAVLAVIRLATTPSRQSAINAAAGTLLGLGVAAIYILPAAYERRCVHIDMAILPGMRIPDNFLFHHTSDPDHDVVLHTASVVAVLLIILTVVTLIAAFQSRGRAGDTQPNLRRTLLPLAILTFAIALLQTPVSQPLWNHLPELAFLQFPWRLIAILAAILALVAAMALSSLRLKPNSVTAIAVILAATLTAVCWHTFHQTCDDEDPVQLPPLLSHLSHGTEPTDEYTPLTADNDSLAKSNPAYWVASDATAPAPANSVPSPAPTHLTLNLAQPQTLILNLRDYPTWRVTLNGALVSTRLQRDDGLIAIPVPAGESAIDVSSTHPWDQIVGLIITLLSLAALATTAKLKPGTSSAA
jgi:uncharacterized membrane protein